MLQEVYGSVFTTEYRSANDRPVTYIPEILERVLSKDTAQQPPKVRLLEV